MVTSGQKIILTDDDKYSNAVGTGDDRWSRGSWKDYYEEFSGRKFRECRAHGCIEEAEHGSHVYVKSKVQNTHHFIMPLCKECNMDKDFQYKKDSPKCWTGVKSNTAVVALAKDRKIRKEELQDRR